MASSKSVVYYVASTHWDREWYEPFQSFRHFLVGMLDQTYDTLTRDPRFACFQTDGQSVILEDYHEIRPERAAQTRELARAGRLRIGPWYTLPDEFIVAPEALIRNLEEGCRVAREFGNVSKSGFVCDLFGHVSQLPQIFQGFGISCAYLFRGVNEDTEGGAFRWIGPDGTEIVTHRFGPREGYFDYGCQIRNAWKSEEPFSVEFSAGKLADYIKMQRERVGTDAVLLFDGGDHVTVEPQTPDVFELFHKSQSEIEIRHVGLDEYSAALHERRGELKRVVKGELRWPGRPHWDGAWVIPGVYSSRMRLKQANRACETALTQWAEPFALLAKKVAAQEYPHGFIRNSWRHVLQNHAHDSICGCSPDQVHKDMEYRFDQSRLINEKVITHALTAVAQRVQAPQLEGEQYTLTVFNPTQADIDGPVDLELWFDAKTTSLFGEFFKFEWKVGFRLFDADGREVPYDYVDHLPQRRRFSRAWGKIPRHQDCQVVTVTAPLRIPAFGYTTLLCKPVAEVTRYPAGKLLRGDRAMENEFLRVEVQEHGTLKLLDKRNGQVYERLLVVEERADIGDGWYHGVAVNDQIYSSTACAADVAVVADGAYRATLRVTNRMEVPARFEFQGRMRRSEERRPLVIEHDITLRAGGDYIEIRTMIDNQIRDHRIRVLFESGAKTDKLFADSAFDVIERSIPLPADNHTYRELAVETGPQASWTAVCDGKRGLAVVAPHLPEAAVRDVPERPIALTLLRGFFKTVFTDGEEGGQSLGRHEFRYRLVPLTGELPRTRLAVHAQAIAGGVRATEVLGKDQLPEAQRTLPKTYGQLALKDGRAIVTSFREAPERAGMELRAFNPYDEKITETFAFPQPSALTATLKSARVTDFEGRELEKLKVQNNAVTVTIGPKKIVTVAVE